MPPRKKAEKSEAELRDASYRKLVMKEAAIRHDLEKRRRENIESLNSKQVEQPPVVEYEQEPEPEVVDEGDFEFNQIPKSKPVQIPKKPQANPQQEWMEKMMAAQANYMTEMAQMKKMMAQITLREEPKKTKSSSRKPLKVNKPVSSDEEEEPPQEPPKQDEKKAQTAVQNVQPPAAQPAVNPVAQPVQPVPPSQNPIQPPVQRTSDMATWGSMQPPVNITTNKFKGIPVSQAPDLYTTSGMPVAYTAPKLRF